MEIPSSSEIALLKKLKVRIQDLDVTDEFLEDKNLVRWLRARRHNLEIAEKMLRKSHEWYVENNIDNLMDSYEPKWATEFPIYYTGLDINGCPVVAAPLGKWDVHKTMALGYKSEFTQYALQMIHLIWLIIKKQSESKDYMAQFVAIYDFKGLGFRQVTSYDALDAALYSARIFEANYPETLKRGFIINAPWAFQILWKAVKPLMDERTHSKLILLGSDREVWREEISKLVPLDQFPQSYGGSGPDCHNKMTINGTGDFSIT